VIAPDRPGIGISPYARRASVAAWARDVVALADQLGIERFGVLGESSGGPYALGIANAAGPRATAAVIVAGVGPLTVPALRKSQYGFDRTVDILARRAPVIARAILGLVATLVRRAPRGMAKVFESGLAPADRATLDRHRRRFDYVPVAVEAFRQGTRGVVADYRRLGSVWGFEPEDVATPVVLWHGAQDNIVAPNHAEYLAAHLPNAHLVRVPDAGHLLSLDWIDDMIEPFAGPTKAPD
jgi:pimeloyl-ACP methyl ester carboxylesterase